MPIPYPDQTTTFSFISQTHIIDRINCSINDITATYTGKTGKKLVNPYAHGHLQAINYVLTQLVGKADFPARSPDYLTNRFKSELALTWLKQIHLLMLEPIAVSILSEADENAPRRNQVGSWRIVPATNSFSYCPPPQLIPKIMHLWLLKLSQFHSSIKDLLNKPFGINRQLSLKIEETAYKANLFIATAQPFTSANNRLGRLVENALRLHWHLPWKVYQEGPLYDKFVEDMTEAQSDLPALIKEANSLKGL